MSRAPETLTSTHITVIGCLLLALGIAATAAPWAFLRGLGVVIILISIGVCIAAMTNRRPRSYERRQR